MVDGLLWLLSEPDNVTVSVFNPGNQQTAANVSDVLDDLSSNISHCFQAAFDISDVRISNGSHLGVGI